MDLSIITISTNELHYLKEMVPSLYRFNNDINREIIVIDNASRDGTAEWLKKNYPRINIYKNRKKQGFAFNNNTGIKRSSGRYVLILNPDVIFVEPVFSDMIKYMDENPEIGLSSCKLINNDGTLQNSVRRFYTYFTLIVRRFPVFRPYFKRSSINNTHLYKDKPANSVFYPDWVLGAFHMVRREVINEVGMLDERFILYFEDVDYCRRVWLMGKKVAYYPFRKIIHLYNRESDVKRLFNNFKLKKGAKIHLDSMIKYLVKYGFNLGLKK